MKTAPTRTAMVDGRQVAVFDGLVPAQEATRYFNTISHAAFTRSETARPDAPEHRHWVCEMPVGNLPRTSLWPATLHAIAILRPDEHYQPYRCYTNFAA